MLTFIGSVVAVVGIIIAFFQWRTSQQKVAMEAHDERFNIYNDLRSIVSVYLTTWPAPGLDDTDLSESCLPLELHRA
jgi:hypothetical protein